MSAILTRPCKICDRPTRGTYCAKCFTELYPEAAARSADTRHSRSMTRTASAYEQARQADEVDAPRKERGPA